jgi:Membrane dipeptidase (Peptidase family M19)
VRGFSVEVSPEVAAFHEAAFVFDLHNDLLTKLTHFPHDIAKENGTATFWNPLRLDLDLPRIRRGGIDALGCLLFSGFRFDAKRRRFWRQLDHARLLAERHTDALVLARAMPEVEAARGAALR